jgi:hypothetical protein
MMTGIRALNPQYKRCISGRDIQLCVPAVLFVCLRLDCECQMLFYFFAAAGLEAFGTIAAGVH